MESHISSLQVGDGLKGDFRELSQAKEIEIFWTYIEDRKDLAVRRVLYQQSH